MNESLKLIRQLVEDFKQQESAFLSPSYQESQVRQDFIDKFFTALGWDVTHERQKNPYEQEVKIENKVTVSGSQRRADYAFCIAPNFRSVKFFVEAKKPSRNLANADDYYQTIRYGWNQGTPLAVLTDFEEFHILDCRYKPDIKTSLDRKIESFHYSDYADAEKFAHIFHLFGREAVANGSLEKFAASLPKPKGKAAKQGALRATYQQVDESFLGLLDGYREALAKEFKNNNQHLDGEELTEAVQRTLDRLVFIRFLEDKSIEEPSIIGLSGKPSAWNAFTSLCRSLEPKYNGLVFKQHRIIDSEDFVSPDDEVFGAICAELSDPASPYDFDKIPISILGSIYERFLGKVVSATEKRAKVEEKPEVRKAGGVYYTPEYIVRYIVKETVGKLIEGKTPAEIAKMAFADIACGSGSFLLEVYGTLLDYHTRWYNEHPDKAKKGDVETREGKLVLSLKKRQEILTNNIYGVDIDAQAYEVTQVSLYLKLLEEATMSEGFQFTLLKEKLLPDLKENIICGNSLIERDILVTDEEEQKLKPMNFADAFPEVMKRGGFDAIVGNPPYVRMESIGNQKGFFERFHVYHKAADLYTYFIERGVTLLKQSGLLGIIVSNKWMRANYGEPLRKWLKAFRIEEITDFEHQQVFAGATTYPCILRISKAEPKDFFPAALVNTLSFNSLEEYTRLNSFEVTLKSLEDKGWVLGSLDKTNLINKLRSVSFPLPETSGAKIYRGIITGLNEAFIIDEQTRQELIQKDRRSAELLKPYLEGKDIKRYAYLHATKHLIFIPNGWTRVQARKTKDAWKWFSGNYPAIAEHLSNYSDVAKKRYDQGEYWWELRSCDYYDRFEEAKVCWGNLASQASFALDRSSHYVNAPACILPADNLYVLGCINSKLLWWYLKDIAAGRAGGFIEAKPIYVEQLPIRTINSSDPADKSRHDQIVKLVEQMLAAKEKLVQSKTDAETHRLEAHCASLDRRIDAAVYELYGLTEEEIDIVDKGNIR